MERASTGVSGSLISLIKRMLESDKSASSEGVAIYTSFGIVRGRITRASVPVYDHQDDAADLLHPHSPDLLEIEDAIVEHYANHLAAARYDRLFINVSDIRSFAVVDFNSTSY
ncbi:MAG TPA: hypothetical protein VFC63_16685 [Blastocatellia bacterium]|nr:hypothetical protein [Blastocatellia bacterium]